METKLDVVKGIDIRQSVDDCSYLIEVSYDIKRKKGKENFSSNTAYQGKILVATELGFDDLAHSNALSSYLNDNDKWFVEVTQLKKMEDIRFIIMDNTILP